MMHEITPDEVCEELISLGGQEYPFQGEYPGTRAFHMPAWGLTVPQCETNDGNISLHVKVYPEIVKAGHTLGLRATFEVFGEAGGRWTKIVIYSVGIEETIKFLPRAERAGKAMWKAFVAAMVEENP
jgi:hypothetical protein